MTATDRIEDIAQDTREQIAQLRRQVDSLVNERVRPALADAAGRAEDIARHATDYTREQAERLSGQVRSRPLSSVVVAACLGFVVGRLFR